MASSVEKRTRKDSVKTCVVCCEDEQFYAIGVCDHWVCYKCCVRMRVLGKENYCSVCRTDLNKVFLTRKRVPYAELSSKGASRGYFDRKYGIQYQDKTIEEAVKVLLEHSCSLCPGRLPENNFNQLRTHVRKVHGLNYCELCVMHLRKYTYERKVYSRSDLARHRRQGDADDKSYKGHPLCEFCDDRYLDNDELHLHLRKTHFWCHFCEREGGQQYYPNYLHLREHFREEHFLCEEDGCAHEKFTSVFCTQVDFQAHIAVKHANKLSKAEARKARKLDVHLQFAPRVVPNQFRKNPDGRNSTEGRAYEHRQNRAKENKTQSRYEAEEPSAVSPSDSDQPSSLPSSSLDANTACNPQTKKPNEKPEDYPSLQAAASAATPQNKVNTLNYAKENRKHEAKRSKNQKVNPAEAFPSLPAAPCKANTACNPQTKKPNKNPEDYPSLQAAASAATPQNKVNTLNYAKENRKHEAKRSKNQKVNPAEAFPSLPKAPCKANTAPVPPPGFSVAAAKPVGLSHENRKSEPPGKAKPPGLTSNAEPLGSGNGRRNSKEINVQQSNQSREATSDTQALHCHERNQALVENIKALLGYNDAKFTEFKKLSGRFRQGSILAIDYHRECFRLFGLKFSQVFFELVDLLPDEVKRQELLHAHQDAKVQEKQEEKQSNGTIARKVVPVVWNTADQGACAQPKQPTPTSKKPVRSNVLSVVSEQDFPSLPAATGKKHVHQLYKAKKTTVVLKEAWVRGK